MRKWVDSLATGRYELVFEGQNASQARTADEQIAMRFLCVRQVIQVTGLSRMTIYRLERAGKFPRHRRLSGNAVAWLEPDIETWATAYPVVQLRGSPTTGTWLGTPAT